LLIGGCGETPGDEVLAHVASASCPLKTPGDWQAFVEAAVDDESWVRTCSSAYDCDELAGAFRARVESEVLGTFARCAEDIGNNPPIASCTARLRRFAPAWVGQHTKGSYGFSPENAAYLAAQTADDVPAGMMTPPPELLAALPERTAIERAARDNGWPYLTHDSGVGGVRTFITTTDPEDHFEQWMLVGLESNTTVPDGSVMSLIAIQKKDATGQSLDQVRMHFRDYLLSAADGAWALVLPEVHDAKCFACHPSGLRTLIRTHESVLASAPVRGEVGYGDDAPGDFGFERLTELNERLLSYGLPDWNGAIEPADHGPALGESLGCPECHDGVTRGVLGISTDEGTLRRKVVEELSMRAFAPERPIPDEPAIALLDRESTSDPPLTEDEVALLEQARAEHLADYEVLVAERFPSWKAWALEAACSD